MESSVAGEPPHVNDDGPGITAIGIASVLLRWRRVIIALGIAGGLLGLAQGLTSSRVYKSTATFLPQSSESSPSGLAQAASQFGIRVPSGSGGWGPQMYVALLRSRALLEPIAVDTFTITEEGGRRAALADLLAVEQAPSRRRVDLTVAALKARLVPGEDQVLGAVTVSITTRWPSLSLALADHVVERVNQFNLETRRSQAQAERRFVETQATNAEAALRQAEDRLQVFLQRNRSISGPQLSFEHDRLKRDVELRQELYTAWLKSREEARIREVRDTPVITLLEEPRLATVGEARGSIQRGISLGLAGAIIGVLLAFLAQGLKKARRAPGPDTREFLQLLEEATPGFLRRRK